MKLRIVFIFICVLFFPQSVMAQVCQALPVGGAGGVVTDSYSGVGIANARVWFGNFCAANNSVVTNAQGIYSINNLKQGVYDVTVSATGCNQYSTQKQIIGGSNRTYPFSLNCTNLTSSYTPANWDFPIVPSNVRNTTRVGNLSDCETTYIDWAVFNAGDKAIANGTNFRTQLFIDGNPQWFWDWSAGLNTRSMLSSTDSSIMLSSGSHTLKLVTDALGGVSEVNENDNNYSRTFNWNHCTFPNIRGNTPAGWDGPIVANRTQNLTRNEPLYSCRSFYLNFGMVNNGDAGAPAFTSVATIDGNQSTAITLNNGLAAGATYNWVNSSYPANAVTPGQHAVRFVLDSNNTVPNESNEGDNTVTQNFTWLGCNAPTTRIDSPSDGTQTNSSTINISGRCTDPDGDLLRARIINNTNGDSDTDGQSGSSDSYSATLNLNPGQNNIVVTCEDRNGGTHARNVRVTYNNQRSALVYVGSTPLQFQAGQDQILQTQQFAIGNNGNADLIYSLSFENTPNWIRLSRQGGETSVLGTNFTLSPGEVDRYTVIVNTDNLAPLSSYGTALRIASNDPANPNASVNISVDVEASPQCYGADNSCSVPLSQVQGKSKANSALAFDPIDPATGNFIYNHVDLALPGRGIILTFGRTYNSLDKYLGPLGFGWTHGYNIFLIQYPDGSVQLKFPDGHYETYTLENGDFVPPAGVFSQLTREATQYKLLTKEGISFIFPDNLRGHLGLVSDRNLNSVTLTYDLQNRLERVRDNLGHFFDFSYADDNELKIARVIDSLGRTLDFAYQGSDLVSVTDSLNQVSRYEYDAEHQLIRVVKPSGGTLLTNAYGDGRVISQTDGMGRTSNLNYNVIQGQQQVTLTNAQGQQTLMTYDDRFRMLSNQDTAGHVIQYQYGPSNLRVQAVDRNNRSASTIYDLNGNPILISDPMGIITQYAYDPAFDLLTRITFATGTEENREYDAQGNLTRVVAQNGNNSLERRYIYNGNGELTTAIDGLGHQTFFTYNNGQLTRVTDAVGVQTNYLYNAQGQLIQVTDPAGRQTRYNYDALGRIQGVMDPDGLSVQISYDADGNVVRMTDRDGSQVLLSWNANGFLTRVVDALGNATSYAYDELNRRISETDAEGRVTRFSYDDAGNVSQITDPQGLSTRYTYDPEGQLVSVTDARGATLTYTYNARGQVTQVENGEGMVFNSNYDPISGQLLQVTDVSGRSLRYDYDNFGRLIQERDALNQLTSYSYNSDSQMTRVVNVLGQAMNFSYDGVGRLESETDALGQVKSYVYEPDGKLSRFTDAMGRITQFFYNNMGQVSQVTFSGGTQVSYTYNAQGFKETRRDTTGLARYTYDLVGRLTRFEDPRGFDLSYGYDRTGLLTSLTYPENHRVDYHYLPSGKLDFLRDWTGRQTQYSYDPSGRLIGITYPNGTQTQYQYDGLSRVVDLKNLNPDGSLSTHYQMELDASGQRMSIDKEGELDPRLEADDNASTYNAENELLSSGDREYAYDANGNLVSRQNGNMIQSLTFGDQGRLVQFQSQDVNASFGYDGDGSRMSKTFNGQETQILTDGNGGSQVMAEADAQGNIRNYYLYGLGLVGRVSADGQSLSYFHFDPMGSTVALSDVRGQITDRYTYDEFGALLGSEGNTPNSFLYAGQWGVEQEATGLAYMRDRYYDPLEGRFISPDPIGLAGGMNSYAYVGGDPVNYVDPQGQIAIAALAVPCAIGGAVGLVGTGIFDVIGSVASGKLSVSSAGTYVGNAVGGCVAGTVATLAPVAALGATGAAVVSGVAGGAVASASTQGIDQGVDHIDPGQVAVTSATWGVTSGLTSFIKIPNSQARGGAFVEPQAVASESAVWNKNRDWMIKDLSKQMDNTAYPDGVKICNGLVTCYDSKSGSSMIRFTGDTARQAENYFSPNSVLIQKSTSQVYSNFNIQYLIEQGRPMAPEFEAFVLGSGGAITQAIFLREGTIVSNGLAPKISSAVQDIFRNTNLTGVAYAGGS